MKLYPGAAIAVAVLVLGGCSSAISGSPNPSATAVTGTALSTTDAEVGQLPSVADTSSAASTGAVLAPTSFTADSPVAAGLQRDGTPLPSPTHELGVSESTYVVTYVDSADQAHVAGVSTGTGKVLWNTEALGPRINRETGAEFTCKKLQEELVTCSDYLINVIEGTPVQVSARIRASIREGFIGETGSGSTFATALLSKVDGSTIWTFPTDAHFAKVLDDGRILAVVNNEAANDIAMTMTLDPGTGQVVEQMEGDVFPSGGTWVRVRFMDPRTGFLGTTERVAPGSGEPMWTADGVPVSGDWRFPDRAWEFQAQVSAPVITSTQVGGESVTADILHALDPATGTELWSCSRETCGGQKISGFTPERLVTSTKLLDRRTGETIADFGGGVYTSPMLLTPGYLVVRNDEANQMSALSLVDGENLWVGREAGGVIEAGSCFVVIDQLTQTRVCPQ